MREEHAHAARCSCVVSGVHAGGRGAGCTARTGVADDRCCRLVRVSCAMCLLTQDDGRETKEKLMRLLRYSYCYNDGNNDGDNDVSDCDETTVNLCERQEG